MRTYIYGLFLIAALISFGLWMSNVMDYSGRDFYTIDSTWAEDTGVLVQLDHGKYSGSKFAYSYNGKMYLGYSHLNYGKDNAVIGERVVLKINPKHPDKYMPIIWKIVFVGGEKTDTTVGTITKVVTAESSNKVNRIGQSHIGAKFTYSVSGQNFERSISVPPYLENAPDIKDNGRFLVEYLIDNPLRGIMHFNKPR